MKKLLWTMVVILSSTAMAALTSRLLDRAYRRFAHEPPPAMPKWARVLALPIKKQVATTVQP